MKKAIVLVIGAILAVGFTPTATAVDISNGMPDIYYSILSTNGKVSAVAWRSFLDNYYAINKSGKDNGWTLPISFTSETVSDIEVMDNGKVVVGYVLDEKLHLFTTKNGDTYLDEIVINDAPDDGAISWSFDIESSGNRISVVTLVDYASELKIVSWTSDNKLKNWKRQEVTSVFDHNLLNACEPNGDDCRDEFLSLKLGQNAKGQQTVAYSASLTNSTSGDELETYVMFAAQRKNYSSKWKTPQAIDSFGPDQVDSWNFWPTDVLVTPKGKSAISFDKYFNFQNNQNVVPSNRYAVSNSYKAKFSLKDSGAMSTGFGTASAQIIAVGEKFYGAYSRLQGFEDYKTSKMYFGEVGKLDRAKQINASTEYFLSDLISVKGKIVSMFINRNAGSSAIFRSTYSNQKWSTAASAMTPSISDSLDVWSLVCASVTSGAVCTAPSYTQVGEYQWDYSGLEANFIK